MSPLELRRSFEQLFTSPEETVEAQRKRSIIALSLLLMTPVVAAFGIEDFLRGKASEAGASLGLAALMAGSLIALTRVRKVMPPLRLGLALILALLLYIVSTGGGEGFAFLWFYTIPILALTLFGQREGTGWALVTMAGTGLALAASNDGRYESEDVWRFLITYIVVLVFSYGLESARYRCYSQAVEEKASIENALAQVKTLRGLLPICTRCKSVRDDHGYWQQIEPFIDRHSDAEFSHGVCPTCVDILYPDLLDESDSHA